MSTKLFELLDTPAPAPTPEQLAARRWIDIAKNIRGAIRDGVTVIATDCATLGRDAVLTEMGPDAAAAFVAALPKLKDLWEAAAPIPFPDLPEKPVVADAQPDAQAEQEQA